MPKVTDDSKRRLEERNRDIRAEYGRLWHLGFRSSKIYEMIAEDYPSLSVRTIENICTRP